MTAPAPAVAAGWALRPHRDGSVPGWWAGPSELPSAPVRGSVRAGLAAGIALAAYRAAAGPASSAVDIQLINAAVLGSGLVAAVVVMVLGFTRGAAGAAGGLLAGPVAALTTGRRFW